MKVNYSAVPHISCSPGTAMVTAVLCTHRIAEAGLRCRQQKLNKYLEAVKFN